MKKTVAEKKAAKQNKINARREQRRAILPWAACGALACMAFVLKFILPGYSFSALVCCALIGLIVFYTVTAKLKGKYPNGMKLVRRVFTGLLCIGLVVVGITEGIVIKASFGDPDEQCQYMVVLGAKVREDGPSVSLWDRIHAAYDYMTAHPEVTAVVSGGQGADEPMTEAQCMYEELVKLGIDPSRIWMEGEATSTWENLHFSLDLIEEKTGQRPNRIGLLSSEYHLFRAGLFADACGVDAVGIPARTSRLSQRINHFMREVAGVWHYILLEGQYRDG